MRVALACHNFPPEFEGGTERVVRALAHALRRAGDTVVVISGSERAHAGVDRIQESDSGVGVVRIPRLPGEGYGLEVRRPRVTALVQDVLRESGSEVLHVHHWSTLSQDLLRAARSQGLGTVATLHDLWTTCPRFFRRPPAGIECPPAAGREACAACVDLDLHAGVAAAAAGLAQRDAELRAELGAAAFVAVPSRTAADRVRRHLPWSGPLQIVPHGLLEPPRGRGAGRPGRTFRVGTFGNLVAEKGVEELVLAMRGVPAELHLHGPFLDPAFAARITALAAELGVRLTCHGPYSAGGGHPAKDLDLAVFPSLCQETYGLVVDEALAYGVPVVVSDRGALKERIGAAGVAVDPSGPALAETVRRLVTDRGAWQRLRGAIPASFAGIDEAAACYRAMYARARAVPA
ncbi:MAG: glycosyltransferase [Planctomycetes bacterium]|nr:glycosyltransferase [Planctomycetota bacterium]